MQALMVVTQGHNQMQRIQLVDQTFWQKYNKHIQNPEDGTQNCIFMDATHQTSKQARHKSGGLGNAEEKVKKTMQEREVWFYGVQAKNREMKGHKRRDNIKMQIWTS